MDEKLKTFQLRSRRRQGCSLPSLLFNTVLEVEANLVRPKKKEVKGIGKEEIKLSLFTDNMIIYIDNLKMNKNNCATNK